MEYIEGFANNKGVNIYYIDNGVKYSKKTPLLICPGLAECAKDYIKLINKITDRRCVALSFRGRGISDSPNTGYTLEDHIEDIKVVIKKLNLKEFCILGISRGVSYELGYSVLNPDTLKGIIISEYPPQHKEMSNGWAEEFIEIYNSKLDDSLLSNEDIVDYINNLSSQSILIKRFDNVGHNIQSEEFEQLARSVEEFLISID